MLLEGLFPAIPTPFHADGRLYTRKLEANIEHYSRTPMAGIVVLGSTGEAVMLSDDESREVLRTAVEAVAPDKVMIAGVARESVAETLRLADFAATHKYDALLVRTPNFYGPGMGSLEMLTYYRVIADRAALPVILYNIPKFTRYEIPLEVVAELAAHPNIIGIKDSTGDVAWLRRIVEGTRSAPRRTVTVTNVFAAVTGRMLAAPEPGFVPAAQLGEKTGVAVAPPPASLKTRTKEVGFQVLSGAADTLKDSLEAGASGGVLALAAFAPQACQEIYTAWKENDAALAALKQERIVSTSKVACVKHGIAGIKHACDLNGYYGGVPRLPLLPLTADQKQEVAQAMADVRN